MKENNFSVMSYNVWCFILEEDRMKRVIKMIKGKMPLTFGVQEATPKWMERLSSEFEPQYGHLGEGRDGGDKGEHMCIFYDTERLKLIEGGTRWLTSTPEVSSVCENAGLPRNMVYAVFEEKETGKRYMHINTHIEPIDEHVTRLLDFAAGYDLPTVITGDFNIREKTELYDKILSYPLYKGRLLKDSKYSSETSEEKNTWHGFGKGEPCVIDYCFVTDGICAKSYTVCDEKIDGEYPSDHHPLLVEFQIK